MYRSPDELRRLLDEAVASGDVGPVVPLAWEVHGPELMAIFLRKGFSQEESEEQLQNVFALMLENWQRFDGRSLGGWLATFARYEAMRVRRNTQRHAERQARYLARFTTSYEMPDPVQRDETARSILDVVRFLEPPDPMIFWMSVEQQLKPAEIAAQLEPPLSPLAVRSRLHRIRVLLRAALEEQQP
ncbi:MAG: RNA polymerase sigma factor (sigma-70 family) [Myxococcota bacterium]|jgi:RNA polymerase sigma factor (sigma-70 family)